MRVALSLQLSAAAALLAVGCRQGGSGSCIPNETRACSCPGGVTRAQTCNAAGTGWSECPCDAFDAQADEGDGADDGDLDADGAADDPVEAGCATDSDCDDSDPCTVDSCDTDYGTCSNVPVDEDGDGFVAAVHEGEDCGGDDCDDTRGDVYPGAIEASCFDGHDDGCDGDLAPALVTDPAAIDGAAWTWVAGAWTGSEAGLIVQDIHEAWFLRVSPEGAALGSRVGLEPPDEGHAALAWTGSGYAMAWLDSRQLWVSALDAEGRPAGSAASLGASAVGHPAVAWTGSELGVAWPAPCGELDCVAFTRASGAGEPLGSSVIVSDAPVEPLDQTDVCGLVWTGSSFGIAWKHPGTLAVRVLSAGGTDPGPVTVVGDVWDTERTARCLAWSGSGFAAVWDTGMFVLRMQILGPDGLPASGPIEPAGPVGEQQTPRVAWAGSAWMMIWSEPAFGLAGTLVSPDGTFESPPLRFMDDPVFAIPTLAAAWTGSEFAVTWAAAPSHVLYFGRVGWCR